MPCLIVIDLMPLFIGDQNYESLVSLAVRYEYLFLLLPTLVTAGTAYLVAHFLQYREL